MEFMNESTLYLVVRGTLAFAFVSFLASIFLKGCYGKHASSIGLNLDPRVGWWLMELPATVSFLFFYFQGPNTFKPVPLFYAALWCLHYSNRGWYFPWTIRVSPGQKQSFSIAVVVIGMGFTTFHGYMSATWYSTVGTHLTPEWFSTPNALIGTPIYLINLALLINCERILRNLRSADPNKRKTEKRYKIPYGGGFDYVTNAQYFFELCAWFGFALMTMNPGGLVVFLQSAANLVPRAFQNHQWYKDTFPEYPKNRKVLIPFLL